MVVVGSITERATYARDWPDSNTIAVPAFGDIAKLIEMKG